ncbi:MAG: class I SAM-dependent methyltransferase [Methylococcales bacterium]|nr:class I SAM-dependent methyltransferase [Methylococcales bacterium]
MLYDREVQNYLKGNKLSSGYWIDIPYQPLIKRNMLLADLARDKKVLHFGCADHIELIEQKRNAGSYLHDIIEKSAKSVTGCDTNEDAIEKMKELGIKNVHTLDALPYQSYDLIIAADVIEHVPNVQYFLNSLKQYNAEQFIITTPNCYRLLNRKLWNKELVNTDHRCWFSPYTLSKSIIDAGFQVKEMYFTDEISRLDIISFFIKKSYPLLRDGLALLANIK